jgi:sugar phosphate isomerase/epimerase
MVHQKIYRAVECIASRLHRFTATWRPPRRPPRSESTLNRLTIVSALKIGIQTRSLRQPLRRALQTAAQLGADGVEIDARLELPPGELSQTGIRQFRKLLADLGLAVSAVSFITRRGYDRLDELERRVLATQNAMNFAHTLGANVVINRVGHVPDEEHDPRFAALVEVLAGLSAYGDRVGARLAAQTGSESGPQLARLLAALPDQTFGVDLHPCGLIHHGHYPAEAVAALGRHVLHVHACDAVRDLSRGQVIDVELGRGAADLPAVLGQLEEFNYRGWVTIECPNSADPVAEMANAVAFLRSL